MEARTARSPEPGHAWRFDGFEALDTCHRETLRMLDSLAELLVQLDERGADSRARAMAGAIVDHFSVTLREHHEDEERHVFARLAVSGDARIAQALASLAQDHFWLDADWRVLSPVLDAVASGQSCYDLDALRDGVEIFSALCREHIELEESLIYPQARARMAACERQAMNREMAQRRRRTLQAREHG
jgi:hemerythrin-like domain-containing protein